MEEIVRLDDLMFALIDEFDECEYASDVFADILDQTQKIVDEFCLHDYSNFPNGLEWLMERWRGNYFND